MLMISPTVLMTAPTPTVTPKKRMIFWNPTREMMWSRGRFRRSWESTCETGTSTSSFAKNGRRGIPPPSTRRPRG